MILLRRRASGCRLAQSQNARHSQLRTPHRTHDRTFLVPLVGPRRPAPLRWPFAPRSVPPGPPWFTGPDGTSDRLLKSKGESSRVYIIHGYRTLVCAVRTPNGNRTLVAVRFPPRLCYRKGRSEKSLGSEKTLSQMTSHERRKTVARAPKNRRICERRAPRLPAPHALALERRRRAAACGAHAAGGR